MADNTSESFDFLESDDLISWLLTHPDGSSADSGALPPVIQGDDVYGQYISDYSSSDSEDDNSPLDPGNTMQFVEPVNGNSYAGGPSSRSATRVNSSNSTSGAANGNGRAKRGASAQASTGRGNGADGSVSSNGGSGRKRPLSRSASGASLGSNKGSSGDLAGLQTGIAPSYGTNFQPGSNAHPSLGASCSSGNLSTSSVGNGNTNNNSSNSSSNKRKKMIKMEELEEKIRVVAKENADLQAHLMTVQRRTIELQRQRVVMEKQMESKVSKMLSSMNKAEVGVGGGGAAGAGGSSSSATSEAPADAATAPAEASLEDEGDELKKMIQQYSSMYADYGEYRKKEVAFHLQQLERLLLPTKTTKLILWALHQDKSFYSPSSPLFQIFCNELGITEEQSKRLQDWREKVIDLIAQLKESLALIKSLKTAIDDKHRLFDTTCGLVESIGTPRQIVSFLLWITKKADKLSQVIPDFWKGKEPAPEAPPAAAAAVDPGLIASFPPTAR